jgi:uncharacterized protein (DUF1501 family)
MQRRDFIHQLAHAAAVPSVFSSFGFAESKFFKNSILTNTLQEGNILVLLRLDGGNDGLNTVIPLNYMSELEKIRPKVLIPENKIIKLGKNDLGLHPSLDGFKTLYDENRLKIVNSVGYPNPDYSHFRSTDIWMSASDSKEYINNGWMGRYNEAKHPGYPEEYPTNNYPHPLSIELGWNSTLLFTGNNSFTSFVAPNPEYFYEITNSFDNNYSNTNADNKLRYLQLIAKQSNTYGKILQAAFKKATLKFEFPNTDLGRQFSVLTKLISSGINTRIYSLAIGGFDTHIQQVDSADRTKGDHAKLLKDINDCVLTFMKNLDAIKKSDNVLGMTFSEFGRTMHSNDGSGTDHGTVAPMFFFGNKVNPEIAGKNPYIPKEYRYDTDLERQFDFRQLYGSVLRQWMGSSVVESNQILFKDFKEVQVIGLNYIDSDQDGIPNVSDDCPDSPPGAIVDINGCEVFTLPISNYKVEVTSTTCFGTNKGIIKATVTNTNYEYTVNVKGPNNYLNTQTIPVGKGTWTIEGLTTGNYFICFTIKGKPTYQQCFELFVAQPPALSTQANVDHTNKLLVLNLAGSKNYYITINGKTEKTTASTFTTTLPTGLTRIRVNADQECQGSFNNEVFISEAAMVYPNPTTGPLNLYVGGNESTVGLSISDINGSLKYKKTATVNADRIVHVDLSSMQQGVYIVKLNSPKISQTFKVIRK